VGGTVQVPHWEPNGSARIHYRGSAWDARHVGHGAPAPGLHVIRGVEGNRLLLSVDSNISRQRVLPDRYPAFVEFAAHIDLAEEAYALIDLASP